METKTQTSTQDRILQNFDRHLDELCNRKAMTQIEIATLKNMYLRGYLDAVNQAETILKNTIR